MIKIITSIEIKNVNNSTEEFHKIPLISPFGEVKITTSQDDAGELTTITLCATVSSNFELLHKPSIVRISWREDTLTFGTVDIPVIFTLTHEDTIVISCKYQTFTHEFTV